MTNYEANVPEYLRQDVAAKLARHSITVQLVESLVLEAFAAGCKSQQWAVRGQRSLDGDVVYQIGRPGATEAACA